MNLSRCRTFIPYLILIVAGLIAYHNSFNGPLIFDDLLSVYENPTIRQLSTALSPPGDAGVGGRPVANLSFAINYAIGGTDVRGYHAMNLLIHILAGLTLYAIMRRHSKAAALPVALIWLVHPLQTGGVTYLSQRCESLMGLFYLLTLYCFIRATESEKPVTWLTLSLVACLAGMATKEVMTTAPVMVLLYDRTFAAGSFRAAVKRRWLYYVALASLWLVLAHLMTGIERRGIGFDLGVTWWQYLLTAFRTVVQYLRLAVWPHPLIFDYGADVVDSAAEVWPYILIVTGLAIGVLVALWRWPAVGFAGFWTLAILVPTTGVVPVTGSPIAEHRMYLPLAGFIALIVIGAHRLIGQRRQLGVALTCVIVVVFTGLTIRRNFDYRTEESIWADTVAKRPDNTRAQCYLGTVQMESGRLAEGIAHLEEAVRLEPMYAEAHNNLGDALDADGRTQEAIAQYQRALELRPNYAEAHNNLGIAWKEAGKIEDAFREFGLALRCRPRYAKARINLGGLLFETGQIEPAIEQYEEALRLRPDSVEAHFDFGIVLSHAGRTQGAITQYEQVLRLKPDFAPARQKLSELQH